MPKFGICGHFGGNKNCADGQTIKTKILYNELLRILGIDDLLFLDTYNWKKKPFKLFMDCVLLIKKSNNIIILPAHNGIKVFAPLFFLLNKLFHKKLHYVVVGGWLSNMLSKKKWLLKILKHFNTILVETKTMKKNLNEQGLNNVLIFPNFKHLNILEESELPQNFTEPYKLCTFSRVSKEKGIEVAIDTVVSINTEKGRTVYTLDIYGQIDMDYKKSFKKIMDKVPKYISYKGIVPFDKTIEVLKNYFLLLFPTYYVGEGFPGTLLDAFSSGLPVLASDWKYNSEIVDDEINGWIYSFLKTDDLKKKLIYLAENSNEVIALKKNCILKAKEYTPEKVMKQLLDNLNIEEVECDKK